MAWDIWSIQGFLAWKLLGFPLSGSFLFYHHLLSLIHACCFLFPPLCSLPLRCPFLKCLGVLWFSKGQERAAYCPIEGRPRDKRVLPPVFSVPCQHHWCHCTHTSASHLPLLVHCSRLLTHIAKHEWLGTSTQSWQCLCPHTQIKNVLLV